MSYLGIPTQWLLDVITSGNEQLGPTLSRDTESAVAYT